MVGKFLLTGAGFSKAFGGYLCDELTAYFFNALSASADFRQDILRLRPFDNGNFEVLLSDLRKKYESDVEKVLKVEDVLRGIFKKMCYGMDYPYEMNYLNSVPCFFNEFDCVFTINQDAIQNQNQNNNWKKKFNIDETRGASLMQIGAREPLVAPRQVLKNLARTEEDKLYIELHGAYDWKDIFIIGDSDAEGRKKINQIKENEILSSYFDFFKESLCVTGSKLVIVGYSFLDKHVNAAISAGIKNGLEIFIWDPNANTYLLGLKNIIEKSVVSKISNRLQVNNDFIDKDILQRGLRGYLPKCFSLNDDDKEDVIRFLKN